MGSDHPEDSNADAGRPPEQVTDTSWAHARVLAPMIVAGALDPVLAPFSAKRFDVQNAA